MAKKIHNSNSFELCYLRHKYLEKANINPDSAELTPFYAIINKVSGKNYSTYKKLFYSVGIEYDDVVAVGKAHLISFLGLFQIEKDPKKFDAFVAKFLEKNSHTPVDVDILDKNKAIFTIFLKQRMEDLVRICRQKVRNVRGVPIETTHSYFGPIVPKVRNEEIHIKYEKLGLKKLDPAIFRAIKKKVKPQNDLHFFFNGNWYITIPTNNRALEQIDFLTADQDPRDQFHNKNPEELIIMSESNKSWEWKNRKFKKIPSLEKIAMLRSFLELNQGSKIFENEIETAQKKLEWLENG